LFQSKIGKLTVCVRGWLFFLSQMRSLTVSLFHSLPSNALCHPLSLFYYALARIFIKSLFQSQL
jgi:hypothetical protein